MANTQRYYRIRGGTKLEGTVKISGAKNAISKQLVASLLTDEPCIFTNVPRIGEIDMVLKLLSSLGSTFKWLDEQTLEIQTPEIINTEIGPEYGGYNRIPILLLGPLLHRAGTATVPVPGGCRIGSRPVDFHISALQAMGAQIFSSAEYHAETTRKLHGADITLDYPSVGATESIIMAAALADGTTTIINAAIEPEIMDTIAFLQKMDVKIRVCGDRRKIEIKGVEKLHGTRHHTIGDRIEAVSFAIAAIASSGQVLIEGAYAEFLPAFLHAIKKIGGSFRAEENGIVFFKETHTFRPIHIETGVYPGFATDWQQPFAVMLTQAEGISVIHETVYEKRFDYVETLNSMGADIHLMQACLGKPCRFLNKYYSHSCLINGPTKLRGRDIVMPDLRAGFAYIIAALIADGESNIYGVEQIERGYANAVEKLKSIGANIEVMVA